MEYTVPCRGGSGRQVRWPIASVHYTAQMSVVSQADSPGLGPCLCTPVPKSPLEEPGLRGGPRSGWGLLGPVNPV